MAISHGFRPSQDLCAECSGMPLGDMGGYIKNFYDFLRVQEQLLRPVRSHSVAARQNNKLVVWWHSRAILMV